MLCKLCWHRRTEALENTVDHIAGDGVVKAWLPWNERYIDRLGKNDFGGFGVAEDVELSSGCYVAASVTGAAHDPDAINPFRQIRFFPQHFRKVCERSDGQELQLWSTKHSFAQHICERVAGGFR